LFKPRMQFLRYSMLCASYEVNCRK